MTTLSKPSGELLAEIPDCNPRDPADLEAHFGNFGFNEHFRKVVLASCREVERAKAALETPPVTLSDVRADNRARCSDTYVQFLIDSLEGRRLREKNVRDSR